MSASFEPSVRHSVLACVDALGAALSQTADVAVVFMDPAEKREALLRLARLDAQLSGLRLRVLAVCDDVAQQDGARDAAALLTHHTHTDPGTNRRDLALAHALEHRWNHTATALDAGEVNTAQAHVITHALDELPADLGAQVLTAAETHLVAQATHFGPRELRVLGRRILEHVAPQIAEHHEATALADEEHRARRRTSLVSTKLGDGTTRITIHLPDTAATRLHTYLEAFTSPRHQGSHQEHGHQAAVHQTAGHHNPTEADRIPIARQRGQAFCALLETTDPHRIPTHGGDATTLIVTIALEDLRRDLGVAELGPGQKLSASEARRLACTANILPAVLGPKSEILDLGRSARLFRPAQRKAMILRDRECRAEGCTIPAAWCEAHHANRPWAQGGHTDLDNGLLLCNYHHHRAHDPTYNTTPMPNGDLRFHRQT